jgi:hypothetical protein
MLPHRPPFVSLAVKKTPLSLRIFMKAFRFIRLSAKRLSVPW